MAERATYVQRAKSDVWHFARNCSRLPRVWAKKVSRDRRPGSGELCNECVSKRRRGVARPIEDRA